LEHIRTAERAVIELAASKRRQFWYKYFYIPGTTFLAHQSAFEKVGGFDESLHTYWEDVDLSVRANRAGIHLGVAPQWEFLHKVGKTCHKDPFYTRHLFHRN